MKRNEIEFISSDIVVFVNVLPIAIIELKSPSREVTNSEEAYLQLQNYMRQLPQLFTAAQIKFVCLHFE